MSHPRAVVLGTWRALLRPRRLVPLALVLGAVLAAEWGASRSLAWVALDLLAGLAFALTAPAAWRLASSRGSAGYAAYVAAMGALVFVLGLLVPRSLDLEGFGWVLDPSGLPLIAVLFMVGGWGLGRDVELEADVEAERQRAAKHAVEAERAGLLALRANLDPHFLFNTLNAIAEWCREDPAVAEAATLKLAAMLRAMLEGIRAPAWPLARELELVRALFALYAIRDRARYVFRLDVEDPAPDARVPPMLLLPLVENAITHGPSAGHAGEVIVRIEVAGERVEIGIENPGPYLGRRPGGEGIAMVERRIALAYRGEAVLELSSERGRTRARLAAPRAPSEEALA